MRASFDAAAGSMPAREPPQMRASFDAAAGSMPAREPPASASLESSLASARGRSNSQDSDLTDRAYDSFRASASAGRRGSNESTDSRLSMGSAYSSMMAPANTAARHAPWPEGWLEYTLVTEGYTNLGAQPTKLGYFAVIQDYAFTTTVEAMKSTWMDTMTASVKQNSVSMTGMALVCFASPDAKDTLDHLQIWSLTGAYVAACDESDGSFVVWGEMGGPKAKGVGVRLRHGAPSIRNAWISGMRCAQSHGVSMWMAVQAAAWLANAVRARNSKPGATKRTIHLKAWEDDMSHASE